jgi:hypothetical protein
VPVHIEAARVIVFVFSERFLSVKGLHILNGSGVVSILTYFTNMIEIHTLEDVNKLLLIFLVHLNQRLFLRIMNKYHMVRHSPSRIPLHHSTSQHFARK